jgi:hypothetical protein
MGRQLAVPEVLGQHSVVEGTLSFRAQFSSEPTTGRLSDSWMIPFEACSPIRIIAAFRGKPNFAGLWCATNRRHVGFESWYERDQLIRLEFDSEVTGLASRPFRITLPRMLKQCEISARRRLAVSRPWASGNSTAIKLLSATHELLTRHKYPTPRDRIRVVSTTPRSFFSETGQ